MAKSRLINTSFWSDGYIQDLTPDEKLIFLYLLTNERTEICGAYEISKKTISFGTGLSKDTVSKTIDRLCSNNKINYVEGWVWIKNFTKHQQKNPKVEMGIQRSQDCIPEAISNRLYIDYDRGSHSNSNSNSNSNLLEDNSLSENEQAPEILKKKSKVGRKEPREDISLLLGYLKKRIGIQAFVDSRIERNFGKNLITYIQQIGKEEFLRRLDYLLADAFHKKNCNKIKYVYHNIKGFIEPDIDIEKYRFN